MLRLLAPLLALGVLTALLLPKLRGQDKKDEEPRPAEKRAEAKPAKEAVTLSREEADNLWQRARVQEQLRNFSEAVSLYREAGRGRLKADPAWARKALDYADFLDKRFVLPSRCRDERAEQQGQPLNELMAKIRERLKEEESPKPEQGLRKEERPPKEGLKREAIDTAPARSRFARTPALPAIVLFPTPPKSEKPSGPLLSDDLSQVHEVQLQAAPAKKVKRQELRLSLIRRFENINRLNTEKTDGFLHELLTARSDLHTLPFAMGGACRIKGERRRRFATAVKQVRQALVKVSQIEPLVEKAKDTELVNRRPNASTDEEAFWDRYREICAQEDRTIADRGPVIQDHVSQARIAALMQILASEKPALRRGLAQYLAGVAHVDATRALARLAIFSAEDAVRQTALRALKVRRERDYTDVLLAGLRYPLPAVARRAADALVKLERTDLVPRLVDLLDEPDPRAPVLETVEQKQVPVVRELVRINHHRNCLLCHAPAQTSEEKGERLPSPSALRGIADTGQAADSLSAPIPLPGELLQGYYNQRSDFLVRVDVTYLRQDFSAMQSVENAHPWPEMQRFDFLVRKRVLTEEEARAYRDRLQPRELGQYSPYHRAVVTALRELTGRDTGPTGKEWRKLLESIEQSRKSAAKAERGSGSE